MGRKLPETGVMHTRPAEEALDEILFVRSPGHILNDGGQQIVAGIGIAPLVTR